MNNISVAIVLCYTLFFYSCNHKSSANSIEKREPITIEMVKDTVSSDTIENIELSEPAQDTIEYRIRMMSLVHDSLGEKWPGYYIVPEKGALLPYNRVIAMYGNFYSKHMGILGKLSEKNLLALLNDEVESWEKADSLTNVIPAIHYIATTAQSSPGRSNTYRLRMPKSQIQKSIDLSRKIKGITFLDIQVGQSTVMKEIPVLKEYLLNSDVHLGLDPEWSMKNGTIPGHKIGTMDAKDINFAIEYLSELVKTHHLLPKILVVHRFTNGMITNHEKIKVTPQVQLVINMDGFGFPAKKKDSYRRFVGGMPVQFTGIKLFYKNDKLSSPYKLMTPKEILELYPKPIYIQYQ